MKRWTIAVAVLLAGGLAWYRLRPTAAAEDVRVDPPAQAPIATGSATAAKPNAHVRQLASTGERAQIEKQIEAAKAARRGAAPNPAMYAARPPSLPTLDPTDIDAFKTTLKAAMHDALPYLAHCYEEALPTLANPTLSVPAQLELVGDPDVGTLIDAHALVDDKGVPLPAKLDDCLRDALQSLELPPLAEGDRVAVTYPFLFNNN